MADSVNHNCYLDKIVMENNDIFECLVIKPGTIKHISWLDLDYTEKLMNLDLFKLVKTNSSNFIEVLAINLEVNKYNISDLSVKTQIIGEEPYYLYEMLYIDLEKANNYNNNDNLNELASLININGDQIYSNAIIFKNYIPSLTDSMNLCTITKADLQRVLYDRVHTKIVIYDNDELSEYRVVGDLNVFAESFFEGETFKKLEIPFLMHNINIWYTTSQYGNLNVCGNLIESPIDKCIWFSMKSDNYRGNITLDEVKKIISLSKVLSDYKTPSELLDEKNDSLGRKIIYNKYKVLDYISDKYITKLNKNN
jgi:hypothetical protein